MDTYSQLFKINNESHVSQSKRYISELIYLYELLLRDIETFEVTGF